MLQKQVPQREFAKTVSAVLCVRLVRQYYYAARCGAVFSWRTMRQAPTGFDPISSTPRWLESLWESPWPCSQAG